MDALAALWFMSIVGAAGFTATGYFLARSRMPVAGSPPVRSVEPARAQPVTEVVAALPAVATLDEPTLTDEAATPEAPEAAAPAAASLPPVAPTPSTPPRRDPRREEDDAAGSAANETDVLGIDSVRPRRGASATPPPVATDDLEKQLQALRVELRSEVVARDKIEMRARELAIRLSSMSEQMTVLRARVSEEQSAARKTSSIIPSAATDARTRLSSRAPGLFAEIDELKNEVARLTAENESLRASALGAPVLPRRPAGTSRTDLIVPEVLKRMVDRIARLDNVRGAAVAETSGLVLAGSGELADALAAFSAYMRDAASRSHRLLPLRATEEVVVRDSYGLVFSTQVLGRPEAELALVTLALGDLSAPEIRKIVAQTPGLDVDSLSAR
jgi:predicted regulator of Ras-like GTPase activity (Roadblock/LC7/MglB family)